MFTSTRLNSAASVERHIAGYYGGLNAFNIPFITQSGPPNTGLCLYYCFKGGRFACEIPYAAQSVTYLMASYKRIYVSFGLIDLDNTKHCKFQYLYDHMIIIVYFWIHLKINFAVWHDNI